MMTSVIIWIFIEVQNKKPLLQFVVPSWVVTSEFLLMFLLSRSVLVCDPFNFRSCSDLEASTFVSSPRFPFLHLLLVLPPIEFLSRRRLFVSVLAAWENDFCLDSVTTWLSEIFFLVRCCAVWSGYWANWFFPFLSATCCLDSVPPDLVFPVLLIELLHWSLSSSIRVCSFLISFFYSLESVRAVRTAPRRSRFSFRRGRLALSIFLRARSFGARLPSLLPISNACTRSPVWSRRPSCLAFSFACSPLAFWFGGSVRLDSSACVQFGF
jgi:hypothetical protein